MRGVNRREVDLKTLAEWSAKGTVAMHSWRSRFVALVLLMIGAIVACSANTEPAGGLQLIVATNLLAPTDFDTVRLEVRQEVSQGQWGSPLIANDFRVPGETTLPTTFAIVAGKSANQNALIRVIALKGQRPLVLREVQIQIPTTRVAALRFVLASSCAGKLKVDATGSAQSACADPLQSCQPDTGACGSTVVDPASLPNYNPGDENGVIVPPAGDANDADAPDVDAAVPDAVAAVPPCQLSKPFGAATALPSLNSIRDEGTAWLTVDENTIYFSREDAASDGGLVRHIYVATRTSRTSSFGVPALLQLDREAAAPVLTTDELVIYFQGGTLYLGDIYAATRPNNLSSFGASTLVAALNSSGDDSAGAFTASGAMYLTRGIANNYAIWKSTFSGSFGIPQMVIEIDTPNQEIRPVLTTDEKTIMFASNRSGGKGNYDIWVATRPNISVAFGAATNVAELNTSSSELPSWISPDGCRIYFTSNRAGGAGGNDFYVAERPKL